MSQTIWKSSYLHVPVVFVGILGVIGIYEDMQILFGHEQWQEYKMYLKYYVAALGALGHALALFYRKKNNGL